MTGCRPCVIILFSSAGAVAVIGIITYVAGGAAFSHAVTEQMQAPKFIQENSRGPFYLESRHIGGNAGGLRANSNPSMNQPQGIGYSIFVPDSLSDDECEALTIRSHTTKGNKYQVSNRIDTGSWGSGAEGNRKYGLRVVNPNGHTKSKYPSPQLWSQGEGDGDGDADEDTDGSDDAEDDAGDGDGDSDGDVGIEMDQEIRRLQGSKSRCFNMCRKSVNARSNEMEGAKGIDGLTRYPDYDPPLRLKCIFNDPPSTIQVTSSSPIWVRDDLQALSAAMKGSLGAFGLFALTCLLEVVATVLACVGCCCCACGRDPKPEGLLANERQPILQEPQPQELAPMHLVAPPMHLVAPQMPLQFNPTQGVRTLQANPGYIAQGFVAMPSGEGPVGEPPVVAAAEQMTPSIANPTE